MSEGRTQTSSAHPQLYWRKFCSKLSSFLISSPHTTRTHPARPANRALTQPPPHAPSRTRATLRLVPRAHAHRADGAATHEAGQRLATHPTRIHGGRAPNGTRPPTKAPHEALRQSLLNRSSPQTKEVLRPREHPGEEDRNGEGRDNHRFNDFEPGGAGQVAEKPSVHEKNPLDSLRRRALEPAQREHPWTSESTNQRSGGRCSARNCRIPGCRSSSS